MALYIASLNSGSNANCYYIGNAKEAVLIDAGLSYSETEKRLQRLGLPMQKIKAVFISHEHSDHIAGLETLHKKLKIPIYITPLTHKHSRLKLQETQVNTFSHRESIFIGQLEIIPFKKNHDAADAHSFVIKDGEFTVGVFTDLGFACDALQHHFSLCDAAFLEANYDTQMLMNGSYPPALKKRISGGNGHLSNAQALELFLKHRSEHLQLLLLSHLSKNNNHPHIVSDLFQKYAGEVEIDIAGRYKETQLFEIRQKKYLPVEKIRMDKIIFDESPVNRIKTIPAPERNRQLTLFDESLCKNK